MSSKNQYNVLVDMEEAGDGYNQPTTIESDGLEFQDFTNDTNKAMGVPPPPTSNTPSNFYSAEPQSNTSQANKPIWSVDYYTGYFDVDTSQVVERCLKSIYPVGDFAEDTLNHRPDLYGPFWIPTTVVFAVFVCSSLAGSLAAYMACVEHLYDFRQLSYAVFVVYMYAFLCPVLVWASTKYFGCQPSLLEIINYYGYSLTIWVPVSVLCVIPYDIARWIFVGIAFSLTGYFLTKNLYSIISRTDAKTSRIILFVILGAHALFALVLKMAFYSYSYTSPSLPSEI
ncbi:Yip1 domain-containing protein [Absidia repens]|uniref:Protein YIP n=1 Tax=Absidia repens TaxID=90262 RepID=A0A1X2ITH1_9FUNG|nr:Yip1 domain-containing protein [Absidia repens]